MIAVCCGKEGGLPELFAQFLGSEYIVGQLGDVFPGLFCYVAGHCKGTAQYFKGIEAETVGFVLYINFLQPQIFCHFLKIGKRCYTVLGKTFVKCSRFSDIFQIHDLKLRVICFGHFVDSPFDSFHEKTSLIILIYECCCLQWSTCASSNPPRCGSLSLNGVRHMPVSSPSAVCKLACTADTADTGRMVILSACSSFVHVAV